MSPETIKHTGTFSAKAEDGREYVIYEYSQLYEGRDFNGPFSSEGRKFLRTQDGKSVNREAKGRYTIIDVERIPVTSDDPSAP